MSETTSGRDALLDFSMAMLKIEDDIRDLANSEHGTDEYEARVSELVDRFHGYLEEGMQRFPDGFSIEIEAETIARALSGNMQADFALKFIAKVYELIAGRFPPIDAISNPGALSRAMAMTTVAERISNRGGWSSESAEQDQVRKIADAVVGRAVLTALSFNVNPMTLRIPYR